MTENFRIENDLIGEMQVPQNALYGIHSLRAKENFPYSQNSANDFRFDIEWFKSIAKVKLSYYKTYEKFIKAYNEKYSKLDNNSNIQIHVPIIESQKLEALKQAAMELIEGNHYSSFIVPPIQGSAGTSLNMNINEIIANRALQILNLPLNTDGENSEKAISPFDHANIFQSTNDVIPSALKIASITKLDKLECSVDLLRKEFEILESKYRNSMRMGYTEMMLAVPTSFGKLFSSYQEAFSRDWWRISKCKERLKFINLGAGAIGTGLGVPTFIIFELQNEIQTITKQAISRSENLSDATSNFDCFVEVHAILKSIAVNFEKMSSDIRLLASDIGNNQIQIEQRQAGSSIMPGKVNPVISEYAISIAHKIYANDMLISSLCGQGCLELNAYTPTIGHALLETIELLISATNTIRENMISTLMVPPASSATAVYSPSITTALLPFIGYEKAALIAKKMKIENLNIFEAAEKLNILSNEIIAKALSKDNLLKLGYKISDIEEILNEK